MRGGRGRFCSHRLRASNDSTAHTACSACVNTTCTGAPGSPTGRRESGALLPRLSRLPHCPTAHAHEKSTVTAWQEAPEAMTPDGVPMTPEALEASSIALAWKLQQEEQAAFYQAISANTPAAVSPGARAAAATPEQPAQMTSLVSTSPEDASLQLALRLQQVSSLRPTPCCP